MKRVLIFFGAVVVLLVGAVAAIPFLITPEFIGEQMQVAVKKATGRTLTIDGAPRLTYWPELAVELDNVALSNPPGMLEGNIANMNRLRVRVSATALLSRRAEIKEITLVRPRLNLVMNANGKANWVFDQAAGSSGGKSDSAVGTSSDSSSGTSSASDYVEGVSIAPIVIEDGSIKYLDERTGNVFAAKDVDVTVSMPTLDSPLKTKGSLLWNRERINMTLFVKSPPRLGEDGSPMDVSVTGRLLEFVFNGRGVLRNGLSLAGNVDMKTSSLRELAKWTGNPLEPGKGLETFSVKGAIDLEGDNIKLDKAQLSLDGMNAQGNIKVSLAGARPKITASLGADRINANLYAEPANTGSSSGAVTKGWSEEKFSFAGLKAVDADLNLAVSQILYGDVKIGRTNVKATLNNGVLTTTLREMTFYDGKANGKLVLNGSKGKPTLQGSLNSTGLDGYRLLADFAKLERISGVTGVNLSIAAVGNSEQEMVSTLQGKGKFQFNDGALRGLNVAQMIRNVQKAVLGGWESQPDAKTDFSLLEASFTIKDGIAQNNDLKLLGPLVRITGIGEIDLLRQALDYKTNPKLVASLEGQGGAADLTGIAVPIIIKGPWSNPKIYPDIEGILQNPQAAFDALAKLTKAGGGVDLEKASEKLKKKSKKLKKKAAKKAKKKLEKVLGDEATEALGDSAKQSLDEQGGSVLKNLLGGEKTAPDTQPAQ
ncbi:MAG: AsmA family protein [Hyphomicrobiales bacterium]|nr:AsmA family protein [Hyphomicrobiales bacterium]